MVNFVCVVPHQYARRSSTSHENCWCKIECGLKW